MSSAVAVDDLETGLVRLLGVPGGRVDGLQRLSGGASRETFAFDLVTGSERRPLILQRLRSAGGSGAAAPMEVEAGLLAAAAQGGVPVPEVVATDTGHLLGAPGIVVRRLEGETIPRRLLRDERFATARSRLGGQVAEAMAAIHALPIDAAPGLQPTDQLAQYRQVLDDLGEPHPAFELGFRWLEANRPARGPAVVVHGDLRLGNLLVDQDGLRAVLDWELAHLGDPLEDLGWFCVRAWRFGSPLPAGGVATREELAAAYAAASGRAVHPDALRWWEVLGTLKWGVICIMQAWSHLSGMSRSVELATIGRRVCENEWDLLGLLPGEPLPRQAPGPTSPGPALHDRPSAPELVTAVREWIEAEVRDRTDGRHAFHARVAANALAMVERELSLEPALTQAHVERLRTLGCEDDRALAERIRSGHLDDRVLEVRAVVAASVHDKLLVANPGWLGEP